MKTQPGQKKDRIARCRCGTEATIFRNSGEPPAGRWCPRCLVAAATEGLLLKRFPAAEWSRRYGEMEAEAISMLRLGPLAYQELDFGLWGNQP